MRKATHTAAPQKGSTFSLLPSVLLQRRCACGNHTVAGGECTECTEKKTNLQRKASNQRESTEIPPVVHEVLNSPGYPLDSVTQAFMEPRFGHDFSQVRLHTDAKAAESARMVNALAYTVGKDVIFGKGQYTPGIGAENKSLAHELTHVVQQQGSAREASRPLRIDAPNSTAEQEAEVQSASVVEARTLPRAAPIVQTIGVSLQRQSLGSSAEGTDDEGALLSESFRQSLTLDDFDSDKATLKPQHLSKLKEYKERFQVLLGRYQDSFISVIGHTDATDTEQHNETLGQQRADAVKSELTSGDSALPAKIIHAGSLGESMLAVETKSREARNRRVEIIPQLRRFFKLPLPQPPQPLPSFSGPGVGQPEKWGESGGGSSPFTPGGMTKVPDLKIPQKNWFEDALRKDPIIRSLPGWARNKVIDALKDGDEMAAEKIIDALPLDDKTKAAVQAVVKSILQMAKGKKFKVPEPPLHEMPPSTAPEFPKAPGEKIFKLPPIPLPFS